MAFISQTNLTTHALRPTGQVRDATKHAHDAILEMFNLDKAGLSKLGSGATNESAPGKPTRGPAGAGGMPGQNGRPSDARAGPTPTAQQARPADSAPASHSAEGDGEESQSASTVPPPWPQGPKEAEL